MLYSVSLLISINRYILFMSISLLCMTNWMRLLIYVSAWVMYSLMHICKQSLSLMIDSYTLDTLGDDNSTNEHRFEKYLGSLSMILLLFMFNVSIWLELIIWCYISLVSLTLDSEYILNDSCMDWMSLSLVRHRPKVMRVMDSFCVTRWSMNWIHCLGCKMSV